MTPLQKAELWLNSSQIDANTKNEIKRLIKEDETELTDSFYKDLEFGTGGLRGIMGVGSNRMNQYTVAMATQGLANYLNKSFKGKAVCVAVAHDCRNRSREFAETTANVFSSNGIKVYLFESLRPTPELSYAIRLLGCQSGVVVTASHNPKEYNGFKAYWEDGGQLVPPHDKNVITEVQKITSFDDVISAGNPALIESIGEIVDEKYLNMLAGLCLSPDAVKQQKEMKIVFSSIHGTGITLVPKILEKIGFKNVHIVEEQANPDGNFPTVIYPNPEEAEAMSLALKKAKAIDADLVMATDPDSDRVGIAVKNPSGEFQLLNGNQTGSLLIYYLLTKWKENKKLTGKEFVVKTIVTTEQIKAIADGFGVTCYDTLTGFKYIAEKIRELEGKAQFIGGGEESYGYLIGDQVRDKDAIAACAIIAEMAAWAKMNGNSLFDLLMKIGVEHGVFLEGLKSLTKKGKSGAEEIQSMMGRFRNNPPAELAGEKVTTLIDYKEGISKDIATGQVTKIDYESSNVLQFITANGSKISVRPSGTEPKIKFYFSVNTRISDKSYYFTALDTLQNKISNLSAAIE